MTQEQRREYNRQYYLQNKQKIRQRQRANRERYPDLYKERARLYRNKNKINQSQYAQMLMQIADRLRDEFKKRGII